VTATTIGQEVAHSYGLEHVNEPGDIMNPTNSGGDASFRDTCIQIVSNQGIACGQQHATHCGSGSAQNAHQELLTLFGTAVPDTQSPSVQIVAPRDGEAFDVGASFEIEVEAQDDTAIEIVRLYNNGAALDSDASEPYGWSVSDIPEGTYELYVEATDLAGNLSTSNVVTVVVGPPGAADGGTDDDGGGGDSGGTDDGGSESAGLPDMFGEDADDQGCGCGYAGGTDREPGRWAALLALMGLSFVRRRRAA
jgi:MYXO-CTERM domain-containing protein